MADLKKTAQSLVPPPPSRPSLFSGPPGVPAAPTVRKSIVPPPPGAKPLAPASGQGIAPKVPSLVGAAGLGQPQRASLANLATLGARLPPVESAPGGATPLSALLKATQGGGLPGPARAVAAPPAPVPVVFAPPAPARPAPAPAPAYEEPELSLDGSGDDVDVDDGPEVSDGDEAPEMELMYSDRPTREVPAGGPAPSGPVAPPPPRLPTLGPEPEFSMGLERFDAGAPGLEIDDPGDEQPTGQYEAAPAVRSVPRAAPVMPDFEVSFGTATPEPPPRPADDDCGDPLAGLDDELADEPPPRRGGYATPSAASRALGQPSRDSMEVPVAVEPPAARPSEPGPPPRFSTSFAAVEPPAPDPRRELEERFALGDYSGALVIAEALLADQGDDPEVKRITNDCRAKLTQMYQSRLGSMEQIPTVAIAPNELKWLSLDHRAGFVLSLIDGYSSVDELLDLAGMPALDVLRTLYELLAQRVIELKGRPGRR